AVDDVDGRRCDDLVIQEDAALGDQPLGVAARAHARPGDHLGDPLARKRARLDLASHWLSSAMMKTAPPVPMDRALAEAEAAAERGEVPIGCAIVDASGNIIAAAGNRTVEQRDP